jgi:hypothetical protein
MTLCSFSGTKKEEDLLLFREQLREQFLLFEPFGFVRFVVVGQHLDGLLSFLSVYIITRVCVFVNSFL